MDKKQLIKSLIPYSVLFLIIVVLALLTKNFGVALIIGFIIYTYVEVIKDIRRLEKKIDNLKEVKE